MIGRRGDRYRGDVVNGQWSDEQRIEGDLDDAKTERGDQKAHGLAGRGTGATGGENDPPVGDEVTGHDQEDHDTKSDALIPMQPLVQGDDAEREDDVADDADD